MMEELHEHVVVDEFIIMPDHIHGILQIKEHNNTNRLGSHMINHVATEAGYKIKSGQIMKNNPMQNPGSISSIIRSYKSQVTKEARKIDPAFKWQSRFHDRIIRSESQLYNVRRYIKMNPKKWQK